MILRLLRKYWGCPPLIIALMLLIGVYLTQRNTELRLRYIPCLILVWLLICTMTIFALWLVLAIRKRHQRKGIYIETGHITFTTVLAFFLCIVGGIITRFCLQTEQETVKYDIHMVACTQSLLTKNIYYYEYINPFFCGRYLGSEYYADWGITGTSTRKRDEFNRLIADCEAGRIDIVLTKSISRFARNTVDLLETVRHLKDLGIEVRFEKENINSFSEDGELMLSLLASFAQEESRSISENSKWGIRRRFQSGEIGVANKHLLGYQYDEERKQYIIIPEEAESVRWMFQMYIDGLSLRDIADNLNNAGIRSVLGNKFQEASVRQLIFNEVYAGDIRRQKCYMADPLKKNKVPNRGELPQYYMADCHEAIIDRETYARVQAEMERRAALVNPTYCFTKKIRCGVCGNTYHRVNSAGKWVYWYCVGKKYGYKGVDCHSVNFADYQLRQISEHILGLAEFDEAVFETEIEGITVLEDGSLTFHFYGGRTETWQRV